MQLKNPGSNVFVLTEKNKVIECKTWQDPTYHYDTYFQEIWPNQEEEERTEDYDERFDTHFHMSDDGDRFYTSFHVFGPEEERAAVDMNALEHYGKDAIDVLVEQFMNDMIQKEDLVFGKNVFRNPAWMVGPIQKHGSVRDGVNVMLKEVFGFELK